MSTPYLDASGHLPVSNPSSKSHNAYPHLLNGSQTRVVHIQPQPGSQNAQFSAYLEVIDLDLDSRPHYNALSYHCGDLTPVSQVHLADIDIYLPIARNLTDALNRVLLKDGTPGPFWIDAISINQHDVEERNQQVRLMTRIFTGAEQVWMWMGADDGTLQSAVRLLLKWGNPCGNLDLSMEIYYQGVNNPRVIGPVQSDCVKMMGKETTRQEWAILNAFFDRPFFRRAWIVQEIAVGRDLHVLCGDCPSFGFPVLAVSAWWLTLHAQLRMLEGGPNFRQSCVIESRIALSLQNMRQRWQKDGGVPFSLLHTALLRESYNARDKFFATRGIFDIPAHIKHHFEVDYGRPVWLVYAEAVRGMIKASRSLYALSITIKLAPPDASFPSWVPRFDGQADHSTWDPDPGSWTSDQSKLSSIPHSSPGTEPCMREDSTRAHILSLLGIKYPFTVAKEITLCPRGFKSQTPQETLRVWEWFKWPAALLYTRFLRRLPLWTSDKREVAIAFAECTTMKYRCRHDLHHYSNDRETIFADFRAYLHAWLDFTVSEPATAAAEGLHDAAADAKVDLDKWDEEAAAARSSDQDSYQQQRPSGDMHRYYTAMVQSCSNKSLFITRDWRFGVGPAEIEEGDEIVVFFGAARPFAVRRGEPGEQRRLVGSAWVPGMMEGEMIRGEGTEGQWFDLS